MSRSSTKGRQERRGPHASSVLPGRSAAARARSLQRTPGESAARPGRTRERGSEISGRDERDRAGAEHAGGTDAFAHRQRLLATSIEGGEEEGLLSADALLLRVDPAGHRAGLARLAEAALAVGEKSDHNALKAAASDSRPPAVTASGRGSDLRPASTPLPLGEKNGPIKTAAPTTLGPKAKTPTSPPLPVGEGKTQSNPQES